MRIQAVPNSLYYIVACYVYGIVIIRFDSPLLFRIHETIVNFYDAVVYENLRVASTLGYYSATGNFGNWNYRLKGYIPCHSSCGSENCNTLITSEGCTSCPTHHILSPTPEGSCTACGPTTHWING